MFTAWCLFCNFVGRYHVTFHVTIILLIPLISPMSCVDLRIDTGGCSVIRATTVFYDIAHLHSSIKI